MAIGTAICECKTCGEVFTMEKSCYNRREANEWEEWASEHYCECTACYRKRMAEKSRREAKTYNLPEIQAVSQKQKAFAEILRNKYVSANKKNVERTRGFIDNPDGYRAKYSNPIPADADKETFKTFLCIEEMYKSYIALTSSSAREIIDALRNA